MKDACPKETTKPNHIGKPDPIGIFHLTETHNPIEILDPTERLDLIENHQKMI